MPKSAAPGAPTNRHHLCSVIAGAILAFVVGFSISKALPNAAHMSATLADVAHVYALDGLK